MARKEKKTKTGENQKVASKVSNKTVEKKAESGKASVSSKTDKKSKKTRYDLSSTGIRRIITMGCSEIKFVSGDSKKMNAVRVSDKSVKAVRAATLSFIKVFARETSNRMKLSDRKTISGDLLRDYLMGDGGKTTLSRFDFRPTDFTPQADGSAEVTKKGSRSKKSAALSLAGCVRAFKNYIGGKSLLSNDAKHVILGATIVYIKMLGRAAGYVASNSKRVTISHRDVETVLKIHFSC